MGGPDHRRQRRGAAARGIVFGNTYGAEVRKLGIIGYTSGAMLTLRNTDPLEGWTEGSRIDDLTGHTNLYGIKLERDSVAGGLDSFSDTRIRGGYIRTNHPGSAGIFVGKGCRLYASDVAIKIHNQSGTSKAIQFEAGNDNGSTTWGGFAVWEENFYDVNVEASSANLGNTLVLPTGTKLEGHGWIGPAYAGFAPNDVQGTAVYDVGAPNAKQLGGAPADVVVGYRIQVNGPAATTYRKIGTVRNSADTRTRTVVTATKTGEERVVRLGPRTVELLKRHRARQREERMAATAWEDPGWVFANTKGKVRRRDSGARLPQDARRGRAPGKRLLPRPPAHRRHLRHQAGEADPRRVEDARPLRPRHDAPGLRPRPRRDGGRDGPGDGRPLLAPDGAPRPRALPQPTPTPPYPDPHPPGSASRRIPARGGTSPPRPPRPGHQASSEQNPAYGTARTPIPFRFRTNRRGAVFRAASGPTNSHMCLL